MGLALPPSRAPLALSTCTAINVRQPTLNNLLENREMTLEDGSMMV